MNALKLNDSLYWVGVLDKDLRVFDIIMHTEFGTTYNSYVLKGSEKSALFESAKEVFFDDYLETVTQITPIENIEYVIVDHTEPDHAGSIAKLLEINPNIKVDTRYTNDYVDTAIAKEYGLSMINDNKCDIIWGVAGNAGNGAAEAALETGKGWFIGVDSDQEQTFSADLAAITLTSGLKNIGDGLIWFFDQWDAGKTYWGQEVNLGIAEGGVGVVTDKNFAKYAPDAVKTAVETAQKNILDGKVTVPSAIGETTGAVEALREKVRP